MRNLPSTLVLSALFILCACSDAGSDEAPSCASILVHDVVALDQEIPRSEELATGEDNRFIVPEDIISAMKRPVTGELQWMGADSPEWITFTPSSGETSFVSTLSYSGPITWSRVPDTAGDDTPQCRPTLSFEVSIRFRTDDGVFDEVWQGTATTDIFEGDTTVEIDAQAQGVPEKLAVVHDPDAAQAWDNLRYLQLLNYSGCRGNACANPQLMVGLLFYVGDAPSLAKSNVNTGGLMVPIAAWSGFVSK